MQQEQSDKMKQDVNAGQNKPQSERNTDQQGRKKHNAPKNYMTKEDIPESTNESDGVPGSGKRQDTN